MKGIKRIKFVSVGCYGCYYNIPESIFKAHVIGLDLTKIQRNMTGRYVCDDMSLFGKKLDSEFYIKYDYIDITTASDVLYKDNVGYTKARLSKVNGNYKLLTKHYCFNLSEEQLTTLFVNGDVFVKATDFPCMQHDFVGLIEKENNGFFRGRFYTEAENVYGERGKIFEMFYIDSNGGVIVVYEQFDDVVYVSDSTKKWGKVTTFGSYIDTLKHYNKHVIDKFNEFNNEFIELQKSKYENSLKGAKDV